MTLEQGIVLGVIVGIFGLFAWGKWRYDIVAVIGLFSLVVALFGALAFQRTRIGAVIFVGNKDHQKLCL